MDNFFHAANVVGGNDGCGAWRMLWPSHAINMYGKGTIIDYPQSHTNLSVMNNVSAVRFQRFCSDAGNVFLDEVIRTREKHNIKVKLMWEVDDIIFPEDIPDYNNMKRNFILGYDKNATIGNINNCDEVSVTCKFLRDYFISKTGKKEVTAIPNFVPDWIFDNFFDASLKMKQLSDNKKKPRVLITGSASHINHQLRNKIADDFTHVISSIISSIRDFQWVFLGALPHELKPYVEKGLIEHHSWTPILEYPKKIHTLGANVAVVPLCDNTFNRAKSNIKLTEYGFMGIPIIAQNLNPYADCEIKFKTGPEMIDQIKRVLKDTDYYKALIKRQYKYSQSYALSNHDNLMTIKELYVTKFGEERKYLSKFN
jgi:hypothetical protein